jgi:hypothetical protein
MFVALGMTASVLAELLVPVSKPEQVSVIAAILLVLGGLAWVFFIFPVFHLMLTFPTGRALSRAWRPFLLLELLALAFVLSPGCLGRRCLRSMAWRVCAPSDRPVAAISFLRRRAAVGRRRRCGW